MKYRHIDRHTGWWAGWKDGMRVPAFHPEGEQHERPVKFKNYHFLSKVSEKYQIFSPKTLTLTEKSFS
jgi:hypothetical protein